MVFFNLKVNKLRRLKLKLFHFGLPKNITKWYYFWKEKRSEKAGGSGNNHVISGTR